MKHINLITLGLRLIVVVLSGTVFFRLVEGWSWMDAYFFTVATISTVGYGVPVPVTDLGKFGATVLIFAGLGVFAVTIQQLATESLAHRDQHPGFLQRWIHRRLRIEEDPDKKS